ncbi:unnamed protein product [Moneuplotes crassus]|uniref:Uncharacterized protein n=1 Tax=Euplotes crassus TaxID=5936 RepID=A0AAD1XK65_EUPCR|nr:unnamed protein product [Moneuplotes crassus]
MLPKKLWTKKLTQEAYNNYAARMDYRNVKHMRRRSTGRCRFGKTQKYFDVPNYRTNSKLNRIARESIATNLKTLDEGALEGSPSPTHYSINRLFDKKVDFNRKIKQKIEKSKKKLSELWNMNKRVLSQTKHMNYKDLPGPGYYYSNENSTTNKSRSLRTSQNLERRDNHVSFSFAKQPRNILPERKSNKSFLQNDPYFPCHANYRFCCEKQQKISSHILYFGIIRKRAKTSMHKQK